MAVWFIPPPRLWWRDRQQHHGYTALASGITGDHLEHSAERNSWSGLWPDDNRILELCLESGSGVAFGLHSVSLLRILCVPSALQRNFADALFAHQADLSRLHVHSRWRRAAVHLEWLRSACRTRCRSKQRANHRYPNNRGQLQLHDHGQRCGITTGSAECDLHYRYRDVINGGFTEKVSVMCPAQHLRRKLMTSSFATFRR